MNELHKSYAILQLTPGTSMVLINQRYKRLVMSWHPDKFRGEEAKATAEREIKKINSARDILQDHFRNGGHTESGNCDCRRAPEAVPQTEPDAAQSARSKDRRSSESFSGFQSSDSTSRKKDSDNSTASGATSNSFGQEVGNGHQFHNPFRRRSSDSSDLRRLVSLLCALFFLILLVTTAVSDVLAMTGAFLRNGFRVGQTNHEFRAANPGDFERPVSQLRQDNCSTDARWYHDNFAVLPPHDSKPTAQDLRAANEDIKRYTSYIAFSQKKLAEIDASLANPGIGALDRRFALPEQEIQTKFLNENQENLKYARRRLGELSSSSLSKSRKIPDIPYLFERYREYGFDLPKPPRMDND